MFPLSRHSLFVCLLMMPKESNPSSTVRRKRLAEFIATKGEVIVRKYSTYVRHHRVCRVHLRSSKCSECLSRNQRCDVRITQSEFSRLRFEKEKLDQGIKDARST